VSGEKPEGVKTWEGIEASAGLNTLSGTSDRCSEQDPGGGAAGAGVIGATRWQARVANGRRVRGADEASQAEQRGKTPER
jgi:hypothetical protein